MKRVAIIGLVMAVILFLIRTPEYWKIFSKDRNQYKTDTFYYVIKEEYLERNPHLKFAEGADDIGVVISYNTEGPGNNGKHNAVVTEGAVSINPLNWKRDTTYADVSENLGSLNIDGELVDGFADAQIDMERGVVVCSTADPAVYAIPAPADELFGPESYHGYDYGLYYANLQENVKTRIAAFSDTADA